MRAYSQINLFEILLNRILIKFLFTIFRLIWNQTDACFVPNQSVHGKFNLISVWFDNISLHIVKCPAFLSSFLVLKFFWKSSPPSQVVKGLTGRAMEIRHTRVRELMPVRDTLVKGLFLSKAASVLAHEIVLHGGKGMEINSRKNIFIFCVN